ncbi:MAG: DUF5925 domain-containing protein [Acidimicrobiales bacterium]
MVSTELPTILTFQGVNELWDAVASLALTRFVNGEEPFAESLRLVGVARATELVPIGSVKWHVTEVDSDKVLARGTGWTAYVQRQRNGTAEVAVTATDPEALAKAIAEVRARSPVVAPRPDSVEVEFWYGAGNGVKNVKRRVDVPTWDDIKSHYPTPVSNHLASLVDMAAPTTGGRLLLWHGPPGTGKTTAVRAMVRAWSSWCRALFVVDAERFLRDAGYLMSVILGADDYADEEEDGPRWRLFVFEDADELLRADAKRETGQSLSRLLNVSDGFIGQGVNVLILITTNEPVGRLHPAVARPGRCLANVEFRAFNPSEAAALIGGDAATPAGDLTLAELFQRRGQLSVIGTRVCDPATGQYL